MKKSVLFLAVLSMAIIFGGCAKVPQTEIDSANAAIEKAKLAEADVYLETEYSALVDSMNAINAEVETNKGKLFKSFTDVKEKLATVESKANELVTSTDAKKESIKQEVQAALTQLQTLAVENAGLVEKAPKGKEGKAAIDAIKSELAVISTSAAEIPQLLENGSLLAAQSKAKAALGKANSINQELKGVVEKYNQRNR